MKKFTLFFALLAISTSYVLAQPSHEKYVDYAAEGVEWSTAYRALDISQIGTKPLYQGLHATAAENDQFFISRVKPRERFTFAKTQIDETKVPDRKFLWWCPIGSEGWNALHTGLVVRFGQCGVIPTSLETGLLLLCACLLQ